ncbi:MAG: hypothetical protein GKR93_17905 [Gammaproteobacteria bacterium]|nr:hypothetical protein [Gammaproteobacteria bacterium]
MKKNKTASKRCAIYTRKSSEEGLEQAFNSLDAQREACESYIHSQRHEGWNILSTAYNDGGFSGGNMDRPALTTLLTDIKAGNIDVIVVYKVDRLSRSLADFVRLIELFDNHQVSFVSVTQQFNTSTSMGRLTLNVLLSFAQFEREVTSERIRDKIAASKQKGMWMGGQVPIGYDVLEKLLVVNESEAIAVRHIFNRYLALGCVRKLKAELDAEGYVSKARILNGKAAGEKPFSRGVLYALLKNPIYIGKTHHKGKLFDGQHAGIIDVSIWQQVQERISRNKHNNRTRTLAKDPSLLAGLLFDDMQHPMSPTHTRKQNRRYRYYISQATLQFKEKETGSVIRIAAHIVESLVIDTLLTLLSTAATLIDVIQLNVHSANDVQQLIENAAHLAKHWKEKTPSEHIILLKQLIHRITISKREMTIVISRAGLRSVIQANNVSNALEKPHTHEDEYVMKKPVQFKRCGIETKLILSDDKHAPAHPETIQAIKNAVTKALLWNDALCSDQVSSIKTIAEQENVTPQFIARRLKLAYLSPDIMEAIFKGNIPHTLSLGLLEKSIPLIWEDQRESFGFAS